MELTLTTEFMSGISGTRICGDMRMMRRVVAPEAVARSMMTRPTPRACLEISAVRASCGAVLRAEGLGIKRDHLNGRVAAGRRRAEGAQHSGTLIAGAEEEWQQAIGRRIDEQNALSAGGERAAERGDEAGFAHAAGKREDGHDRSARGGWGRRGLRWRRAAFEDSPQSKPARGQAIARALQRVFGRRQAGLAGLDDF